jgi:hypothetical protein
MSEAGLHRWEAAQCLAALADGWGTIHRGPRRDHGSQGGGPGWWWRHYPCDEWWMSVLASRHLGRLGGDVMMGMVAVRRPPCRHLLKI